MMVNIEQLTSSVSSLPNQPNFIRHVVFGLLAILTSFVLIQMQQNENDSRSNTDSGILAFIFRVFFRSTFTAIATWLISIWTFFLRILGTTVGVGLGLGLAGHIYDSLDDMSNRHRKDDVNDNIQRSTNITVKIPASPYASSEDPNSYHSLMKSAGYIIDNTSLRAQMVRGDRADVATQANGMRSGQNSQQVTQQRPSIYKFDKGDTAFTKMKSMWPNLSPAINESLAKLTEFVLRDYVCSWFGKVDENVPYEHPTTIQDDIMAQTVAACASVSSKGSASSHKMISGESSFHKQERRTTLPNPDVASSLNTNSSSLGRPPPSPQLSKSLPIAREDDLVQQQTQNRTMVLTTIGTLPSPFIESLYTAFAYLLGTLATRASENVNVLELLLLHLPHVLGKNLKVYRELKQVALEKKWRREGVSSGSIRPGSSRRGARRQYASAASVNGAAASTTSQQTHDSRASEEDVSEIAIIREYLLAGRLHRALTFGLDVPSLLFADPLAKDCPTSASYNEINDRLKFEEDSVLEDRLLSPTSTLVAECELDYNRVMASRIAKLVVPKSEIESSIVKTMLVEMLASCVLMPVMGCFAPDSVNGECDALDCFIECIIT